MKDIDIIDKKSLLKISYFVELKIYQFSFIVLKQFFCQRIAYISMDQSQYFKINFSQ